VTATAGTSSVASIVRSALAARTGSPVDGLGDDVPLAEVGFDSLDVIELLVRASEQIADEYGVAPDAVSDPQGLPWIETVGDLVELVTAAAVAAGRARSELRR
jgi:acyl carrier protein